ncbi:MAG TPA: hypothetical protein VJM31_06135, partial [Vicinamibacterales bacterium]|nr:hypothetical protein [Vicinamibacterales bacterium]
MSEPQFALVSGTNLYWLQGSNRTIGFQATSSSIGENPTLRETWSGEPRGVYFFVPKAPTASDQDFERSLKEYLGIQGWPSSDQKFLWLDNPDAPVSTWVGLFLRAALSGSDWRTRGRPDFDFINYTFSVLPDSLITLASEAQGWGFAFNNNSAVATFSGPNTSYNANNNTLLLPFAGAAIGCWRFAITLKNGDDFELLETGIRYFYPLQPTPEAVANLFVKTINLPTILQPSEPLNLDVSLNSLHPLIPDLTYFSFIPLNQTPPLFESMFATAYGYGVQLRALAASGTTPDARFVFTEQPRFVGDQDVPKNYYLTLQGGFAIEWDTNEVSMLDATGASVFRLLCGTSGLEYLGMPSDERSKLEFIPGQKAYAPLAPSEEAGDPLTNLGTTAWTWASTMEATKPVRYYAQPEDAPLYQAPRASEAASEEIGSTFLDFLEIPALLLPSATGATAAEEVRAFPLAPYNHLAANEIKDAKKVEAAAIAPARRQAILKADPQASLAKEGAPAETTATVGVTPQGLSAGIAENGIDWTWAGFANDQDSTANRPELLFTKATGKFRQALMTNRLFMVLANAGEFMEYASVKYQLTTEGIAELRAEDEVPANILDQVNNHFRNLGYPVFENEELFVAALIAATPAAKDYEEDFERKSGLLVPTIGDWAFQMSPRNWFDKDRERQNTMVIYKFSIGRSLAALTNDLPSWTWPEAAAFQEGGAAAAQAELQNIYEQARLSAQQTTGSGKQSPYANFIRILDEPNWTGIIAFSVEVPLNQLPGPLQALAAGIETDKFYAHHVGFNITPFGADPGKLTFG